MTLTLDPVADVTRREFIAGGAAMALLLAACGGDDGGGDDVDVRQVDDALGPVDLPARPDRIIADGVNTMGHLWALGIVPLGVAATEDVRPDYIGEGAADVPNLVADDGWTLNVEAVVAAQPELVVATGAEWNIENCERYKAAVTTFCYADDGDTEADAKETFVNIAIAVGREDEAAAAIAAYDARKADLAERIAATDLPDQLVGVVRFDAGGFIGIRPDEAMVAAVGLSQPEWPEANPENGYVELSLETLEVLNAADVLIINLDDNVDPAKVDAFNSPLWERLTPVADGQAHIVGGWNGSNLPQFHRILTDIEETLVIPAEQGEQPTAD